MATKRDYYEVMGVPRTATADEIKKAYRKLAKECHPDLHPNDKTAEARFKELNEANEVLSDPDKRARYDQFGMDGPMGGGFDGGGFGGFGGFSGGGMGGFESIFDQLFGGMGGAGRSHNAPMAGDDLRFTLNISFEEAAFGVKKSFEFTREENCVACHGSGAKPGTTAETCSHCHGTGQVRTQRGFMVTAHTCPTCGGTGKFIKEKCSDCGGRGRVTKKRTANVNIPAGIDDGQVVIMSGQGEAGRNGGPNGDLQIVVRVRPHKFFKRSGKDLYLSMPISFTQATLGADIEVPTLEGKTTFTIPEGTQTGSVFRIRGKGLPQINSAIKGDLMLEVQVEIPKKLSDKQKELLKQFEASISGKEYQESKSFLDKVKDFLKDK